jgi:hypothetical protein
MRPIQNFEKLHETKVTTQKGNPFLFEIGKESIPNIGVWIFDNLNNGGIQGQYCTHIRIDWQTNSFDLRKCKLGEGLIGEDIHKKLTLPIRRCKTKDEFINFVTDLIENEAMKGTYNY